MKIQLTLLCGPERHFWICPELHAGVLEWSHDPRIEVFQTETAYGYFTSQEARNVACEKFMANPEFDSPTDCLIMIDNDTNPVNPKSGTMNNLMDLPLMGLPIVGCPVPIIHGEQWMLNAMYEEGDSWRPMSVDELSSPAKDKLVVTEGGPAVKVDAIGFGVICIQRGVLETFTKQARFEVLDGSPLKSKKWFSGRDPFKSWDTSHIPYVVRWRDDRGATVKGEDFLFCKRAKELGIQSHVAPQHYCGHHHTYDYGKMNRIKFAVRKGEAVAVRKPTPADYGIAGPCPLITEWAIEPELAMWIQKEIADNPIYRVMELGSGVSTIVIADALSKKRPSHRFITLDSLDHDKEYCDTINAIVSSRRLQQFAYVWDAPLVDGFYKIPEELFGVPKQPFDLMLIDGPPAHLYPTGRQQASKLFPYLKKGALIVLDDADREEERLAMATWMAYGLVSFKCRVGRAAVMEKL